MTELSGRTELTCCDRDQNISQCLFYAESRNIGLQNSSDCCCKLTISREELLKGKAGEELRTTIIFYCRSEPRNKTSQVVTITIVEDELLYATVNHSAAGENSALAVKYESGTDYATVVIN
ncbi:hypothetical protein DPX16_13263 [Anabarilius grahami]|uniref:Uncharacterized protein n=1 Tax=Anabarilius grahami TaxID=495550 RepID=A0A3N0YP88_ANAGA|nr:hypothetical protein DPX16_13263 [Anabarilius grahami]